MMNISGNNVCHPSKSSRTLSSDVAGFPAGALGCDWGAG